MAIPKIQDRYTEQQYLDFERKAEERHEYLDGEIILMAGEKLPHGLVSVNLVASLATQLKGKPCFVLTKDSRIRSGPTLQAGLSRKGLYSYPDLVVVCGTPEYLDEHEDVILNPRVIIEVLSKSTASFDRGEKCVRYQTYNDSLTDLLFVAQDSPTIEHYRRRKDNSWTLRRVTGADENIRIVSIGCTLALADIFDRVTFTEDS